MISRHRTRAVRKELRSVLVKASDSIYRVETTNEVRDKVWIIKRNTIVARYNEILRGSLESKIIK